AIAGRIPEMLGELRGVDEQLLGHASANDAGSAEAVLLGDRYPLAQGGGNPAGAHPTGAAAGNDEIIVEFGHGPAPMAWDHLHVSASPPKEKPGWCRARREDPASGSVVRRSGFGIGGSAGAGGQFLGDLLGE